MTDSRLTHRASIGLLVVRVGASALLFCGHGWPKIAEFAERSRTFADPLHVGSAASLTLVVFAEVVCTPFVALGLFTRLAVVPIVIFTMVATFIQHAGGPLAKQELALLYALPFIALWFTGPGRYSLDARIARATGRD